MIPARLALIILLAGCVSHPAPWPDSLRVIGDGYPASGDSCRHLGETAATVDFLDHTRTLVGCPTPKTAQALGGTVVGVVDGITLVSIPN